MGYTTLSPSVIVEIAGDITITNFAITTVAGDQTLSTITIPNPLIGTIKNAYIDLLFPIVKEESAGDNKISGNQYVKVYMNADIAHQYNAILFPDDSLMIPASFVGNYGRIYGNIDIAPYIEAGDVIHVFWNSAKVDANVVRVYGNQAILRLILGV